MARPLGGEAALVARPLGGEPALGRGALGARLPLQLLLIAWASPAGRS